VEGGECASLRRLPSGEGEREGLRSTGTEFNELASVHTHTQ